MYFETMKKDNMILEAAVELIKRNGSVNYQWYAVKTKKDILVEAGGRNKDGKFEIKTYIPEFENGEYVVYSNGYSKGAYSVEMWGFEYPTKRLSHTFKSLEAYLDFINNTDFKQWWPRWIEKTRMEEVVIGHELTNLK